MADLVARGVFFVFGELDALAVMWALVESCEGSFDIAQGFERDWRELGEDLGIEKGDTTHPFVGLLVCGRSIGQMEMYRNKGFGGCDRSKGLWGWS